MVDNLDRKVMYWVAILTTCGALFLGFLFTNKSEFLIAAAIVFVLYSYRSLHRCPLCSSFIFSWALRCDKCEKETGYYKKEIS